jgi:hypothetical protein
VTGASTSLVRDIDRRASGDASLVLALLWLLLVPLPALLASAGAGFSHTGFLAAEKTLAALVIATPVFAVVPFVAGCGLGTFLYLAVTAPERFAAMRADREAPLGGRSLVAMSLLVGGAFAATGLVAAIALF